MKIINTIKRFLHHQAQSVQIANEIREGIANQSSLLNRKLNELNESVRYLSSIVAHQQGIRMPQQAMHQLASNDVNNGYQAPPFSGLAAVGSSSDHFANVEAALAAHPLRKTYNTNHPDYDVQIVRNFPGKVFNHKAQINNPLWGELKKMMRGDEISEDSWASILRSSLEEAKSVPGADQVFERKLYVEKYMEDLESKYGAFYRPGWVNLDDALFLYWVVRTMKPKVVVQTGVCNGLSSAFMMLALAKNGPEGTLHVVDMPPVFDPNDDDWKVKDKVYGVTIPEGKTSGWLVPDAYHARFEVLSGDAKELLPPLLKKLGTCDMFYHDSDHTYDHMIFEFEEAKKYLTQSGVIVSDDISWNASLWDFADQYHVPAYNYRGSMGIACF
jgi:predicted O-methyltransferase YrrM